MLMNVQTFSGTVPFISGAFVMSYATIPGIDFIIEKLRFAGRTLRESFGEHLRSIDKNALGFPVAEHFSSNGYTAADALVRGIKLCDGNKQRKKQEMRLIFRLGKRQPRGLNAYFHVN